MYNIEINNGEKVKCPKCHSIFAIKNGNEILYRNITLLYFNTADEKAEAKCKQCKYMIQLDLSDINSHATIIE